MRFAKLFDLQDKEQVLLTVGFDEESDEYKLNIESDFGDAKAKIQLGFAEEEHALNAMDKYDIKTAEKFRATMSVYFS